VHIESVSIDRVGYPVEQVSNFECSDDLLNRIWRVGVDTLSVCMQDAFEDCPLREHGQYPGDARVQALMQYYCFFDSRLPAKALRQFLQSQRSNGLFNALWPSSTNHVLPDYNLVWVMMLHDYLLYTGDRSVPEHLYANVHLLLENWMRSQESESGLLSYYADPSVPMHEWWLFIDHAPLDKRGEVAAYNAFYYKALRDAASIAALLHQYDDLKKWNERAKNVRDRFNERFWNEELGAYVDCFVEGVQSTTISVQTNTLAILFGLSDELRTQRAMNYLDSDAPRVESSGPYFDFYVLQMLAKLGRERDALQRIRRVWGGMLERGATVWWETFDPNWPEGQLCPDSLCHAWSGAPTYFLPAEMLGVKPLSSDSDSVAIQPRVGDLQWAKGSIVTKGGRVDVEWIVENGAFSIEIDAPCGFTVGLPVKGMRSPKIEEIDLSPETPTRRVRKTYGWDNVIWRNGHERDPYVEWLRRQETDPPEDYISPNRCSAGDDYIWVRSGKTTHVRYVVCEEGIESL